MATVLARIDGRLRTFIESQPVFFVGSAPSGGDGHVNVSPKGLADTFRVVDEHTVAYLDLTASGAETIAHLRDTGRIVLMFCSFERSPNIVRLHGRGPLVSVYDPDFAEWASLFPGEPDRPRGRRRRGHPGVQLVRVDVAGPRARRRA